MSHKDEEGIWHVDASDTWSAWGRSHIDFCPKCRTIMGGPPYSPEEWDAYVKAAQEHGVPKLATKEILESTCDRCGNTETTYTDKIVGKSKGKDKTLLPTGWTHINIRSAFAYDVVDMDLCGQCSSKLVNWTATVEAREGE